jgi:hypothetical protein
MVRTFLKHAEEIQGDEALLSVPRTLFDSIRAVEPARERGDTAEFLHRLSGKLGKIRRVAELFEREYRRVSDHTNFQMAALSLTGCVRQMEEIFAALRATSKAESATLPETKDRVGPSSAATRAPDDQLPPNPT